MIARNLCENSTEEILLENFIFGKFLSQILWDKFIKEIINKSSIHIILIVELYNNNKDIKWRIRSYNALSFLY